MRPKSLLVTALLAGASMPAAQAKGDLEHWLRLCEKPRLEYWDKLCAAALEPQNGEKVARTDPAKPTLAGPGPNE